jgi:hypothetical protein
LVLTWVVQFCKSSCITSHGCEVFRGIGKVRHWWHTRSTNLINASQSTKYLVLGDCKSASPGRNKVSFLTEQLVSTKGKYLSTLLSLCRWRGLKMSFWISAPSCAARLQVYSGYNVQHLDFEGDEIR